MIEKASRCEKWCLAHWDSDVDAQVAVVREQLGNGGVEDEAVWVEDGAADPLVDGAGRRLPGQASPVPVQL